MRKISVLLLSALMVTFAQCKKNNDNNANNNVAEKPYVTATIGSMSFSAQGSTYANGTFSSSDTLAGFRGTDSVTGAAISIDLVNYKGVGVYSLSGSNTAAFDTTVTISRYAAYGTLTITDTTTDIKGTFSFTCVDSTRITEGKFLIRKP